MHGSSSVPQEWLAVIREFGGEIPETYGVPVEEIQEGIRHGVRKVNIDTDIRLAMTGADPSEPRRESVRLRSAQVPQGRHRAARSLCKERFEAFGSAGHASKIKPIPLEIMARRYAERDRPGRGRPEGHPAPSAHA